MGRERELRQELDEWKVTATNRLEIIKGLQHQLALLRQRLADRDAEAKMLLDALLYANDELVSFLPSESKNYYKGSIIGEALATTSMEKT
jgi:hypothetical protein